MATHFWAKSVSKIFRREVEHENEAWMANKKTLLPEVKFESNYREKNKNKTILIKYQRIKHGTIQNKFAHPKEFPQKISRKAAKPISTNWFLYPSCQYPIGYQEISRSLPLYPSSRCPPIWARHRVHQSQFQAVLEIFEKFFGWKWFQTFLLEQKWNKSVKSDKNRLEKKHKQTKKKLTTF